MSTTTEAPAASTPEAPPPVASPALHRDVARRLAEVRERQRRTTLSTGLAMAFCALLGWLAFEMIFDWCVALHWPIRALIFLAGAGGTGWLAWKLGIQPYRQPVSDETAALMIEREMPVFRGRFIASVQLWLLPEAGGSPALIRALIAETAAMAKARTFDHVVKTAQRQKWAKIAAGAAAAALVLWLLGGTASAPLLARALLWNNPVPRRTQVSGLSGDRAVAIGDDVRIEARVAGSIPGHGRILLQTSSGKKQEFSFDPEAADRTHFSRVLQGVQEPFDYVIELGDARTDSVHIKVKPRPGVLSIECTQVFPAYTKQPPQKRATGDLKLLAGSHLGIKLKANAKLKNGQIRLVGADLKTPVKTAPMNPAPHDGTLLTGDVEIGKDDAGLNLLLVDEDGVESKGGAVYRIEVVPDLPPTVAIRWPDRREELLTPGATMLLAFEAKDDFGIAKIRLHYAVDWSEGAKDTVIDLDLGNQTPREVTRRFEWNLSRLKPAVAEGQVIDYWLEVVDINTATGPGVATMEHYQARIVSELEKRADLSNRLNDAMQGLDEVRHGQEDVSKRLGDIIFEKPPGTAPPK